MKKLLILITFLISLNLVFAAAPNPGHTANETGGDSDAERTFYSTGKYSFPGNLDIGGI